MAAVVHPLTGAVVRVGEGPRLLAGIDEGPSLAAHRSRWPRPPQVTAESLARLAELIELRGRGGAAFPFARKLRAAAQGRRPVVVVNLSEGEPASFKDAALALTRPHLILDGAEVVAVALGAGEVHLVLPGEHSEVRRSMLAAVAERATPSFAYRTHVADTRFVAGQARAVLELMSGRPNLPVTAWTPEAIKGYRSRPTLLSNAETFAQLAAACALGPDGFGQLGTPAEPGTTLLTFNGDSGNAVVREAAFGTPWSALVVDEVLDSPILFGGYHGAWLPAGALRQLPVSRVGLLSLGATLGAGIVLPLSAGDCPLSRTARVVAYLAKESAGRCGPCVNGLPALAAAVTGIASGLGGSERVAELVTLPPGRGACAHPDGTTRLVSSMMRVFPDEIERHAAGHCAFPHVLRSTA